MALASTHATSWCEMREHDMCACPLGRVHFAFSTASLASKTCWLWQDHRVVPHAGVLPHACQRGHRACCACVVAVVHHARCRNRGHHILVQSISIPSLAPTLLVQFAHIFAGLSCFFMIRAPSLHQQQIRCSCQRITFRSVDPASKFCLLAAHRLSLKPLRCNAERT